MIVEDWNGRVVEAWSGPQVAWSMARGYSGAFGEHVTRALHLAAAVPDLPAAVRADPPLLVAVERRPAGAPVALGVARLLRSCADRRLGAARLPAAGLPADPHAAATAPRSARPRRADPLRSARARRGRAVPARVPRRAQRDRRQRDRRRLRGRHRCRADRRRPRDLFQLPGGQRTRRHLRPG